MNKKIFALSDSMNPNPLFSLNYFTVPTAMINILLQWSGNTLPENPEHVLPAFNWVGLMQELLENHLERNQTSLAYSRPNCFYRFTLGEKLEGINLQRN